MIERERDGVRGGQRLGDGHGRPGGGGAAPVKPDVPTPVRRKTLTCGSHRVCLFLLVFQTAVA